MQKNLITIAILFISFMASAQQNDEQSNEIRTLLGHQHRRSGGYGGFGIGYSTIDNKDAIFISGRAAWIAGQSLGIGVAGTGFINDYIYDPGLDENINLNGGYGGILIEPILIPRSPVHLAFPVIAGVGGIGLMHTSYTDNPWEYRDAWIEQTETFLIIEPGVELELNLLRFFRFAVGTSYRFTSAIRLPGYSQDLLEGLTVGVSLKFGKF